jgi:NAD(P)-dependent dehydrogenase (short-subunit alcohol dehydrogenase family)
MSLAFVPMAASTSSPEAPAKGVLVTGASTGMGRKITERLAHDVFFVRFGAAVREMNWTPQKTLRDCVGSALAWHSAN